jgi:hypothetical protein
MRIGALALQRVPYDLAADSCRIYFVASALMNRGKLVDPDVMRRTSGGERSERRTEPGEVNRVTSGTVPGMRCARSR